MRIYDYQKSILTQIVLIMSSVDLDADELDQITDMQSLYIYLYGEDESNNIVEELPNIVEELPNANILSWLDEIVDVEIYDEMTIPKEYKRVTVELGARDMPAKVRNKFMCEICEQLYNNDRLKKHYLKEHNKVQCNKCGVLLDADDVEAIGIHNKNCYIGFKDRNIVSANFSINMITALENSIVTYMCYPNVKTRDLEQILNNF